MNYLHQGVLSCAQPEVLEKCVCCLPQPYLQNWVYAFALCSLVVGSCCELWEAGSMREQLRSMSSLGTLQWRGLTETACGQLPWHVVVVRLHVASQRSIQAHVFEPSVLGHSYSWHATVLCTPRCYSVMHPKGVSVTSVRSAVHGSIAPYTVRIR